MTPAYPILGLLAFTSLAGTLAFSSRRKLGSTQPLIGALHPKVLTGLERFLTLSFADDAQFMTASGGYAGMRQRRDNAQTLLHLFQHLEAKGIVEPDELSFLSDRAHFIVFFAYVAIFEEMLHKALPNSPHFSARIVAIIYSEMQARALNIAEAYSPLTFAELDAVL